MELGIGDGDWGLRLKICWEIGLSIGKWDWGLGLGIEIGD